MSCRLSIPKRGKKFKNKNSSVSEQAKRHRKKRYDKKYQEMIRKKVKDRKDQKKEALDRYNLKRTAERAALRHAEHAKHAKHIRAPATQKPSRA